LLYGREFLKSWLEAPSKRHCGNGSGGGGAARAASDGRERPADGAGAKETSSVGRTVVALLL